MKMGYLVLYQNLSNPIKGEYNHSHSNSTLLIWLTIWFVKFIVDWSLDLHLATYWVQLCNEDKILYIYHLLCDKRFLNTFWPNDKYLRQRSVWILCRCYLQWFHSRCFELWFIDKLQAHSIGVSLMLWSENLLLAWDFSDWSLWLVS